MGRGIEVKETIEDPETWFNIKRFKIGDVSFDGPEKALDIRKLDKSSFDNSLKHFPFKISEFNRQVKEKELYEKIFSQKDPSVIDSYFFKRYDLAHTNKVLNFTFDFNPRNEAINKDVIRNFLSNYHSFSHFILTVPNSRLRKNEYDEIPGKNWKRKRVVAVTPIDAYLEFVDYCVEKLSEKNGKPIFVPIPIIANGEEIKKIVDHYIKKEYFLYWMDFEGEPIFNRSLGTLRDFYLGIKEKGYYNNIISYFTNIKREITSHPDVVDNPGSDILATLAGANLIGIDKKKLMMIEKTETKVSLTPKLPFNYNARELLPKSYWYRMTDKKPEVYTSHNSIVMAREFFSQSEEFEKEKTLAKMVPGKAMISEFNNGVLLKLLSKDQSKSLKDKDISEKGKRKIRKTEREPSKASQLDLLLGI